MIERNGAVIPEAFPEAMRSVARYLDLSQEAIGMLSQAAGTDPPPFNGGIARTIRLVADLAEQYPEATPADIWTLVMQGDWTVTS